MVEVVLVIRRKLARQTKTRSRSSWRVSLLLFFLFVEETLKNPASLGLGDIAVLV